MSFTYNVGSLGLQNGTVDFGTGSGGDVIEVILVKDTYTPNKDDTYAVFAAAEISGVTGYTGGWGGSGRKVLAGKAISNDTTNDRTKYDADNPSLWTLGTGDTIGGAIIAKKGASDDTTAIPLFYLTVSPPRDTNGGTFGLEFNAGGLGFTQQ